MHFVPMLSNRAAHRRAAYHRAVYRERFRHGTFKNAALILEAIPPLHRFLGIVFLALSAFQIALE